MSLGIVRLYHDLLSTYGDAGNADVLAHRAAGRGVRAEIVEVGPYDPVPETGDIYLLGGGEDGPQSIALELLAKDGGLNRAVDKGAAVLAVCAGFQIVGATLPGAAGVMVDGLGLVEAVTEYDARPRSVGEVVVRFHAGPGEPLPSEPLLTGFENHQGVTRISPQMRPLGTVLRGHGNGLDDSDGWSGVEGVHHGKVIGTYMHGPVLVRNPQLADVLLASVLGELAEFDDPWAQALAAERRATLLG